jgi:hypothetical protein
MFAMFLYYGYTPEIYWLQIIYYPFAYGVALGCAVLSLVFLIDFLKLLARNWGNEE